MRTLFFVGLLAAIVFAEHGDPLSDKDHAIKVCKKPSTTYICWQKFRDFAHCLSVSSLTVLSFATWRRRRKKILVSLTSSTFLDRLLVLRTLKLENLISFSLAKIVKHNFSVSLKCFDNFLNLYCAKDLRALFFVCINKLIYSKNNFVLSTMSDLLQGEHDKKYDHDAFLGKDTAAEFEELTPEKSKEKLA